MYVSIQITDFERIKFLMFLIINYSKENFILIQMTLSGCDLSLGYYFKFLLSCSLHV